MDGADPPTAPRALKLSSILPSLWGKHGEHEKYEKHQPYDLKHSIMIQNTLFMIQNTLFMIQNTLFVTQNTLFVNQITQNMLCYC